MALIADGQQAIVDDVRAAIPRGIDPTAGQIGALDALSIERAALGGRGGQVYRFVPFRSRDSCGIERRVADWWGFREGSQEPLDLPGQPTRAPRYSNLWLLVITVPDNSWLPGACQPGPNSGPGGRDCVEGCPPIRQH